MGAAVKEPKVRDATSYAMIPVVRRANRTQDPSFSHSRPFFGCLDGTFSFVGKAVPRTVFWSSSVSPPQALDPLVVHLPPDIPQQGRNPAITIAAILPGQLDHVGDQVNFIRPSLRQLAARVERGWRSTWAWPDARKRLGSSQT